MGNIFNRFEVSDTKVDFKKTGITPTYDPQFGFKVPRKEKVSKLTLDEMKSLQIPPKKRDYCAHLLRDYYICRRKYFVLSPMCKPEIHLHKHCEREEMIMRMKENEREKRLKLRELKIKEREVA